MFLLSDDYVVPSYDDYVPERTYMIFKARNGIN